MKHPKPPTIESMRSSLFTMWATHKMHVTSEGHPLQNLDVTDAYIENGKPIIVVNDKIMTEAEMLPYMDDINKRMKIISATYARPSLFD